MQVLRVAIQAAKAGTLRSAQSLPRTAAVAAVQVLAQLRLVPEGAEVASALKVRPHPTEALTARAAAATAARAQA